MFGSGRAILSLRESYRDDLRAVKAVADFRYVRFHAIFHDEVGVYNEDEHGNPVYNFSYVDQIYDGLLKMAFGPSSKSASCRESSPSIPTRCIRSGTSPMSLRPRAWIAGTISFATSRSILSIATASTRFRTGTSKCGMSPTSISGTAFRASRSYFDLYAHTARDLKSVSPRLRVGGPATAAPHGLPTF